MEASFVFSIIAALYYALIIGALILFMRCYESQKTYINDLHYSRTSGRGQVREVIYKDLDCITGKTSSGVVIINPFIKIMEERNGY